MVLLTLLLSVLVLCVVYLVNKISKINRKWSDLGVPHPPPVFLFGNLLDVVLKRRTLAETLRDIYNDFPNEPIVGYYHFLSPRIIVRDLDLVERILIKDFVHFVDRAPPVDIKNNPLVVNLFALCGNTWRAVRAKFSPMFTTGKLRHMFPQVGSVADELMKILDKKTDSVDIKAEGSKFAIDVIGSCAFGFEPGAMDEEDNEFKIEAKAAFAPTLIDFARLSLVFAFPGIARMFGLQFSKPRTIKYFTNVVRSALVHRQQSKEVRKDFVQQMVTLLEKGSIDVEKEDPSDGYLNIGDKSIEGDEKLELTEDVMVGQAFVFLLAGFEAASTTIAFMCMELAANPAAQERARAEVVKAAENELTYDSVKDMQFLDGCLKETLRIHPPVGTLGRMCVKEYNIPGTNVTVRPGEFVMVASTGIHGDPNIYPDPARFNPDRWVNDSRRPCAYLPFGDGPRICIGMRFAIMEIKCCLAKILLKYKIQLNPSTTIPVKINPHSFFGSPLKPILLNFEKLAA
ncbi:hypothetical protein GE061_007981 [Apolygus lucorum]|uniref:Cytochrome P450 n=1 Tax=Apolygus lucorum TaxID=248454 RepID=A0A6A4J294_APOLU|nr:hypothetical protein GE061_007981 [Apolygus lucorum]